MDMHELARPQIAQFLSGTSAKTMAKLQPAMERALETIEAISPALMMATPAGMATAYGPSVGGFAFNMVAATPEAGMVLGWNEWGEVPPGVPDHEPASLWATLAEFIETKADGNHILTAVMIRLGEGGIATVRTHMAAAIEKGLTPFLLVLVFSDGGKAAGLAGVIVLPASLERQLAEIEGRDGDQGKGKR